MNINKKGEEVAGGIVWIVRFALVLGTLTFLVLITGRLTNITHDTLETDAKIQATQVIQTLSQENPLTGEKEFGIIGEKEITEIEPVIQDWSMNWTRARPQKYVLTITKEPYKITWYVNRIEYIESEPYLTIEGSGKSRDTKKEYYALYKKENEEKPISALLEVTTIERNYQ